MTLADTFAVEGMLLGIEATFDYIEAMTENIATTTALEGARAAMSIADTIANEGIKAGFEATLDYISALAENETVTLAVDAARGLMTITDAFATDGILAGVEAALKQIDAITDNTTVTKILDSARGLMTVKDAIATDGIMAGVKAGLEQIEMLTDNRHITLGVNVAKGAMAVQEALAEDGIKGALRVGLEQIDILADNEYITGAVNLAKKGLAAAEWLAVHGIDGVVDAARRQIAVFGDDIKETVRLLNVRESMTDADGNFCLQMAKNIALQIFSTIMRYKDKIASAKQMIQRKKESIVAKKGAVVDAVAAKAKMAKTAAIPFVGPILVGVAAAALVAGIALMISRVRQPVPLATGGVATNTTFAMIGEGRYDEAVVPLGNSPQFRSMKEDIANAVIQGMSAVMSKGSRGGGSGSSEIVLNIDGSRMARLLLPNLATEQQRVGYNVTVREI